MKKICLIFITITLLACGDDKDFENSFIKLDKNNLNINPLGGTDTVTILSNIRWEIYESPDWCSIIENHISDGSLIVIETLPNKTGKERHGVIKISGGEIVKYISVNQYFNTKDDIDWKTFPVNSFFSVKYTLGDDGIERTYRLEGTDIFINKSIYKKVYNGNLFDRDLKSVYDLKEFKSYTYNPITIACFVNGKFYERKTKPAINEMVDFAREINQSLPQQNLNFSFSNTPIKYRSYRQLHLLGKGNLGIKLDELLTGVSYQDKELSNKVGYIFSYSMKFFDVIMDIPDKLIQEDITDEHILGSLSFVNNISYGKTAYLIIECPENDYGIKNIIDKLSEKVSLDSHERAILENANSYYIHFNEIKDVQFEHGKSNVIEKYINSINETPIIPLSFSALNYADHSLSKINLTIDLP